MALAFDFSDVNWVAVLVSGVASMVLGFLWYGLLFGKMWTRAMGWESMTKEQLKAKQKSSGPGYALSLVGALVVAYAVALVVQVSGAATAADAVLLGILLWLAFIVPLSYVNAVFQETNLTVTHLSVGYRLLEFLAFALILTMWA